MQLHTVIGLFGVICYVLAYALVQLRKLSFDDARYSYLNIVGSACGLYSLAHDFNLAAFVSQSLWLVFTLMGVLVGRRHKSLAGKG